MEIDVSAANGMAAGAALRRARKAVGWTQRLIADRLGRAGHTVHRWEVKGVLPALEVRIELLKLLAHAPPHLLEDLARHSGVALDSVVVPLAPVVGGPQPSAATRSTPMEADAQRLVDDAVREAAEDLNVSPRKLRPILGRLLDRMRDANVPMDAGARMVLGVPKREPKSDGGESA